MAFRSGQKRESCAATILATLTAFAIGGCGPIEYVNQVTRKASASVAAARAVDADKYSPYYYTLAVEYLHKARAEAASADFQAANRFGRKAERAAAQAKLEALDRAGQPVEKFLPEVEDGAGGMAPLVEPRADAGEADVGDADGEDADTEETGAEGEDEELPPGFGGEP